jgi:hypothetical protein
MGSGDWLIARLTELFHEDPDKVPDQEIQRRIKENEVVIGVWRARDKPGGIDYFPLKGDALLAKFMAGQQPGFLKLIVVPCYSFEDALTTKRMYCAPDI